ncbi:MAG TPA: DUF1592 domain-containing protein, partial [Beijerinckiaceae bacterium]|nr:DUF1592 domain-containing protein [Beijerinckiaceae bacterium]
MAAGTRLRFPESDAAPARIEAFGRSLVGLVNRAAPEKSALLLKPTNRKPHTGGERIKPGSGDEQILRSWVDTLARLTPAEAAAALRYSDDAALPPVGAPVLRRLTHSQYNNTVRDLLGELSQPAGQFPPEDFVNGFNNQYQEQSLSPALFEAYSAAAEKLARNVIRRGNLAALGARAAFVRQFGEKAFRRPLTPPETKRYETLLASEPVFEKGAQAVIEAMLQSPNFLFRLDDTPDAALKPYATASRLSYALWNTMPDKALLESAAGGELGTPEGLQRVVRRLLAAPQAKEALNEFVAQWLRFDRALTSARDRRLYPNFSRETAVAMTEETRRFVADLVWNNRDFTELFTAPHGYVNPDLATLYGVTAPTKEFDRVDFTPESERAGILGQGLFLTLTSKPNDTSPTARGLFIREHFLCQKVADPPPGVSTDL